MNTTRLPTCDTVDCQGHLGKFSDCLTEALYDLSMGGMYDSTGSTEAHGHFTLMVFDVDDVHTLESGGPDVTIPAGAYIVQCTEQGFVYTLTYSTQVEAQAAFAMADSAYGEWLGDDD